MIENVEQAIRDYLPQIIHMSLGTSKDNKPWVCEVHFAYDEELNLYFRSQKDTRHCQEIAENKFVAGNIVTQHADADKPRGVYFEGTCEVLEDVTQESPAYIAYTGRFAGAKGSIDDSEKDSGFKFYKIKVKDYYMFDVRESVPPQKYHLAWK